MRAGGAGAQANGSRVQALALFQTFSGPGAVHCLIRSELAPPAIVEESTDMERRDCGLRAAVSCGMGLGREIVGAGGLCRYDVSGWVGERRREAGKGVLWVGMGWGVFGGSFG